MTPREKAYDIWQKMINADLLVDAISAKQCALIAVDEIINNFGNLTDGKQHYCAYSTIQYYKEVKEEIQYL